MFIITIGHRSSLWKFNNKNKKIKNVNTFICYVYQLQNLGTKYMYEIVVYLKKTSYAIISISNFNFKERI